MVDDPAAVPNQQQAAAGPSMREMERGGHHTTSGSDSDSDFNIADLIYLFGTNVFLDPTV